MNKTMTTLAGFAVLAAASMVPASAQTTTFTASGPFTFTYSPTTLSFTDISGLYNMTPVTLSLTGGTSTDGGTVFTGETFSYTYAGLTTSSSPITTTIVPQTGTPGSYFISGMIPATLTSPMEFISLAGGTPTAPVPEASTVVSFGALLALGGLAVLRRKSTVKNAA